MLSRFTNNRSIIEKYLNIIEEIPLPKTELDIIVKKKEIHLEYVDVPIFSKKFWEEAKAITFGIPCFILDKNSELVECYHKSQVSFP